MNKLVSMKSSVSNILNIKYRIYIGWAVFIMDNGILGDISKLILGFCIVSIDPSKRYIGWYIVCCDQYFKQLSLDESFVINNSI